MSELEVVSKKNKNGDKKVYKISRMIDSYEVARSNLPKTYFEKYMRIWFAEEIAQTIKDKLKIRTRTGYQNNLCIETFFMIRTDREDPEIELLMPLDPWIPVDKTPPKNILLLLSFKNLDYPLPGYYKTDNKGGAFYLATLNETCISRNLFVNAWRVSDLPYREEGEEEYDICKGDERTCNKNET